MKELIRNFPLQITEAIQIGKNGKIQFKQKIFSRIILSGLGGSGIGGSIAADYLNDLLSIPFLINKTYSIPKCTDQSTLFIACSYSGNTEETLQAAQEALSQQAEMVCITSGGALAKFAQKNKLPLVIIPAGMPPRACLGYSLIQILFVLKYAGVLKTRFEAEIMSGLDLINKQQIAIHKQAKDIAAKLPDQHIAIYTISGYEGLAIRFRQQLNENSKVLAWHNVIPEMTHNEIVGWKSPHPDTTVLFCYSKDDFEKNIRRLAYLKKVVKKYTTHIADIQLKGKNYWEKAMYFIHLTDWISVYLSDLNGHDAVEVKVIDGLKKTMAKK